MTNCKILITGCSSGIGYYCAKTLHEKGYFIIASARKPSDVKRLQEQGLHAVQLDLDSSQSIDQGIADCLQISNGKLDVLFNNGAYGQPGAVEDLTRKALEEQFSSNVFGTHELTQKLIPTLLQSDKPRIIQNSSVLGLVAMKYRGAYVASKFALEGLTDTLRLELSDTPIKVSIIEPGPITSKFRDNAKLAFIKNIDIGNSRHQAAYQNSLNRFASLMQQPFTLTEDAVYKRLQHAIDSNHPKARYYVTFPTYLFAYLKRILSTSQLDWMVKKTAEEENKRYDKN